MIIDAHAHLVTPLSVWAVRTFISVSGGHNSKEWLRSFITDEDLKAHAAQNIALMDAVGTDMQLLSPRPFTLMHSHERLADLAIWVQIQNDLIHRVVELYPARFRGVAGLPQMSSAPVDVVFDELERCIDELGFVGVLVNPDPDEGRGIHPSARLGDKYWHPLWARLVEKDIPAHIHSAGCYGRENYDEHFASEESLAITSILASDTFKLFPNLKLMISHGGGAIPYQIGRWRAHWVREQAQRLPEFAAYQKALALAVKAGNPKPERPESYLSFDEMLKRFNFDTVVQDRNALSLLFRTVGSGCCLFGSERPGSASGIDPESGADMDDLRPMIESVDFLSDNDKQAIFEGNARRVFNRIDKRL